MIRAIMMQSIGVKVKKEVRTREYRRREWREENERGKTIPRQRFSETLLGSHVR